MSDKLKAYNLYREKMNDKILSADNLNIKRFFNIDNNVYQNGALDKKTKELLGLVASMVLRCNDCISYHIITCAKEGFSDEELFEALSVALVVGGSITIPHLRFAVEILEEIRGAEKSENE